MTIENRRQWENTRKKLAQLQQLYAEAQARVEITDEVRELTLRSLMKRINQFKEEMVRFESHSNEGVVTPLRDNNG
jgi:hypothetical protein